MPISQTNITQVEQFKLLLIDILCNMIWFHSWPSLLPAESWSEQFMYILFWGTASVVSLAVIYIYGSEFVDQPKLVHTHARVNGAVMYDTPKTAWERVCPYTASFHMTGDRTIFKFNGKKKKFDLLLIFLFGWILLFYVNGIFLLLWK